MIRIITINVLLCFSSLVLNAQLLATNPAFPTSSTSSLSITLDANMGNKGLLNYTPTSDVYVHIGVITNNSTSASDWKYVKFNQNFNTTNSALRATSLGNNKWQFTLSNNVRSYFGVPSGETILKIAILFRNGNGSKVHRNTDGTDMYIPIYTSGFKAAISNPYRQPTYNPQTEPISKLIGNSIDIAGVSNTSCSLKLFFNGNLIESSNNVSSIQAATSPVISFGGTQRIVLEASNGSTTVYDTIQFFVDTLIQPLPTGVRDGLNFDNQDSTAVTFVLYAPGKNKVSIIGDLPGSNWQETNMYSMKKSPDGNYWWLRITGLQPRTEYSFQYLVNGNLRVTDPYVDKVLDPWNDSYISAETYPNLKAYPYNKTSNIVGTFQIKQDNYQWSVTNFNRPDKRRMVLYELHLRDFVAKHDWKTLIDTIGYLKTLGINAIELMPVNEFEGNNSWGYNPDFYFAVDKFYGPKNDFKRFIDTCHSKGIAVVMDMVLNHSFGLSPLVQLYYDTANSRPAANNPWHNPVAKHAYNVGYDFNHESLATRYFSSRVMEFWLTEFKIDGFRFDLSKGFTQNQTCDNAGNNCNVNSWTAYDASRIAIWKRYYDTLQLKSPGSYAILEHFADNWEEMELSNYGLLLWGNMNNNYAQASMGYNSNFDLSYGIHTNRGWANPHLVTFMESHDEERLNFKNNSYGNAVLGYDIKDTNLSPRRMELAHALLLMSPGPKMIWQFGELGYDSSINYCQNGTISTNCRTDMKPIKWDYYKDPERRNLYQVVSKLNYLRNQPQYQNLFSYGNIQYDLGGYVKWIKVTQGNLGVMVIGNFDVVAQSTSVSFPFAGNWYNYLNPGTFNTFGGNESFTLAAGEYRIYTSTFVPMILKPELTVTPTLPLHQNNLNLATLNVSLMNETFRNYRTGNLPINSSLIQLRNFPPGTSVLSATATSANNAVITLQYSGNGLDSTYTQNDLVFSGEVFTGGYGLTSGKLNIKGGPVRLFVRSFIEGYYTGSQTMRSRLYDLGLNAEENAVDSVLVSIWDSTNLQNIMPDYQNKVLVNRQGWMQILLPGMIWGNKYYIALKAPGSVETWSATTLAFTDSTVYDFTLNANMAYSDGMHAPMALMQDGKFAFYSGDVNGDGSIDLNDLILTENESSLFGFGYENTDCTGDGSTDLMDLLQIENNAARFIFSVRP